jgi:nucleotide-binding universal stress UspA family protein
MSATQFNAPLKVLLAIDGSAHSAVAVNFAIELISPHGMVVHVLAVVPERWSLAGLHEEARQLAGETLERMRQLDRAAAEGLVTRTREDLHSRNLTVATEVVVGRSADVILKHAAEQPTDLIIVGAKGLGAPAEYRLGSTAHKLAHDANCSVLITRPPERRQILNVVLAADGSADANRAASLLCSLALPAWTEITVVGVAEMSVGIPADAADFEHRRPTADVPEAVRQVLLDAAEARISDVLNQLHSCHAPVHSAIRCGNVARQIIASAEEQDADLIVIGARGPTRSISHGLGSVADQVIKYAPCSVLIAR